MMNDKVWPTFSRLVDGIYQVFVIAPDGTERLVGTAKPMPRPQLALVGQHFTVPSGVALSEET